MPGTALHVLLGSGRKREFFHILLRWWWQAPRLMCLLDGKRRFVMCYTESTHSINEQTDRPTDTQSEG